MVKLTKKTKRTEFEIFSTSNYDFIPGNVLIIKDKYGWVFACRDGTKWYVNSTQDSADCKPEENEKFIKKFVKAIKEQMKLVQ